MSDTLPNPQDYASEQIEQSLVVTAGAGTGKTRTLIQRIINHIKHGEMNVWQILAVTFTEKAASEIVDRVRSALLSEIAQTIDAALRRRLKPPYSRPSCQP